MPIEPTVFAQLMNCLPHSAFRRCVERYDGDYKVQSFSCMDQFLCLAFAQLTYRESLRDIETCLRVMQPKLYHMGFRGNIARSTLAYANERRDWRIYADFAKELIAMALPLYKDDSFGIELSNAAYALDSTTIDLSLSLFPWAHFRKTKGAIKLHTLLNLRGNIPEFINISSGNVADVNAMDIIAVRPGAFYVMDRAYLDFARLHNIHLNQAFFVTRAKRNTRYSRRYSHPVEKDSGLRCDQTIVLTGASTSKRYPGPLRRVSYVDTEACKKYVFLTNNFAIPAIDIASLYRARWQIEMFFKWIKQHLRIKAFYGTSENAVKTQIWVAVSVYVLVALVKKQLKLHHSLYTILQILSIAVFEKMSILRVFTDQRFSIPPDTACRHPSLFDL